MALEKTSASASASVSVLEDVVDYGLMVLSFLVVALVWMLANRGCI